MGPFYAYFKYDHNDWYTRLVTFASRETADEWWRMISTPPSPYATNVERVSPQFYIQHNTEKYNALDFSSCATLPNAQQFRDKVINARLENNWRTCPFTIPPMTVTDHISGNWYFIRSKVDPFSFWYFCADDACLVCGIVNFRTLADNSPVPENFVMIGKDKISISAPMDYAVHVDGAGKLKATAGYQGETDILFNDLKNRFITRARRQVNGEIWEYAVPVQKGLGEAWELVD